jgi:diguanylate cyclase (GGDEF)-like protein
VLSVTSAEEHRFDAMHEDLIRLMANCTVPSIERARLERLSITDDCTAAYNQRYLMPRLADEIDRARKSVSPLSVLLLDLDHFKQVNDTWGHQAGDDVLAIFADRARDQVRRQDALVRRGGEEFVLIMPDTGREEAEHVAERIRRAMDEETIALRGGVSIRQSVSIGVATWDGSETPAELENRADRAMYAAKEAGRNRVTTASGPAGP